MFPFFNRKRRRAFAAQRRKSSRLLRHKGTLAAGVVAAFAAGNSAAFAGDVTTAIVPDGRTQTTATVTGQTTTVTTNTFSGGNAFNSISAFDIGRGDTVNLVVPSQAGALINIVRDRSVTIEGTLNSVRNGRIGGNVFFAVPHGFIVGESGGSMSEA